ncbi:MAG: glycoside hydrolase family 127 protein, partial [Oscillospiraceae bacterium]|nr:glycoside hydrolase family 127 protein [Oscillospiraceae bacterium]
AYASTDVPELTGCTAVWRGPLVYCFEGADNGEVLPLCLKRGGALTVSERYEELDGAYTITAEAVRTLPQSGLYSDRPPQEISCTATAIPYYTWGNRGENQMRVWMTEVR